LSFQAEGEKSNSTNSANTIDFSPDASGVEMTKFEFSDGLG